MEIKYQPLEIYESVSRFSYLILLIFRFLGELSNNCGQITVKSPSEKI